MYVYMRIGRRTDLTLILIGALALAGCSPKTTTTLIDDPSSPTYQGPTETTYCSTPTAFPGSTVTISGLAQYTQRQVWTETDGFGDLIAGGLGGATTSSAHPAVLKPIRRAEVRVLDSSGSVVQCAETDGSGHYSFAVPASSASYQVTVNSRANNNYLKASVLNKPIYNQFYSLAQSFTPNASKTLANLTAAADGDVLAGAFNILDQLLNANIYLAAKAGGCSVFNTCADFTVAPKVVAYWTPGFNPNTYFGSTSGLSFYLPGYSRLFILGGLNGDTEYSDTDHFDNSVIIHEYGHFLEDSMFKSDSPGGSHNGNRIIDPRLAWSEGWGNFIQAAVRDEPHYIDTIGNDDGLTDLAFYVDLETPDSHDAPTVVGEGNFREFAVTRFLWDIIDNTPTETGPDSLLKTDNVSDKFVEIWASLTKSSLGFKDNTFAFRNVGLLHLIQENLHAHESADDWSQVRIVNRHLGDESHYAQYVTAGGSSCSYDFDTYSGDSGLLSSSNLFTNNRFYHLRVTASGTYTLRLDYQDADGTGSEKDLDLYLYNRSARFGNDNDIVKVSRDMPDGDKNSAEAETFTVSLSAGDYLINVNVYTRGGTPSGEVDYTLKLNGSYLCPASLVPP